jgi:hypothetical protein
MTGAGVDKDNKTTHSPMCQAKALAVEAEEDFQQSGWVIGRHAQSPASSLRPTRHYACIPAVTDTSACSRQACAAQRVRRCWLVHLEGDVTKPSFSSRSATFSGSVVAMSGSPRAPTESKKTLQYILRNVNG